jgi:hypothetical protein
MDEKPYLTLTLPLAGRRGDKNAEAGHWGAEPAG